ncbi:MAG: ATP-binding cassette domain-containing protein [Pirellulales bacterium]
MATETATNITEQVGGDAIRVRELQHFFGEADLRKQVLFDNRLEIRRGEIVIMTGPSGSGKTTLLTLIGTLRRVQEGSVEVLDRQLFGASQEALVALRREIGFIFQAHNLFESLSAVQNVRMAMELFDFGDAETSRRATGMLERLGLGHRTGYKPDKLSGGQKQRVAIARGLAHGPRLVLADEPTAALDEESGREVVTLFQELAQRNGTTILMVTHDNRILDVADRIVNMVDGRIKSNVLVAQTSAICEFLMQCPVFEGLTPNSLTRVADQMTLERHPAGATIIRQGDPGDKFYIVRKGSVDVFVDDGQGPHLASTLNAGSYFGEVALLTGGVRTATVVATQPLELYALGKDDFQSVVATIASFEQELRKALFERQ